MRVQCAQTSEPLALVKGVLRGCCNFAFKPIVVSCEIHLLMLLQ